MIPCAAIAATSTTSAVHLSRHATSSLLATDRDGKQVTESFKLHGLEALKLLPCAK